MDETGVQTIIINNFSGRLTRYTDGDMNSGYVKYETSHSYDVISTPSSLSFMDLPVPLSTNGIDDLILAGKERKEGQILYVYAVSNNGKVYKIQVNNPNDSNPDYDTAVVLTTITIGTPTFRHGASIEFYEDKIFIGHDVGVTRINFDGTAETQVGTSWTPDVPRPVKQFVGNLYYGNDNNIAEINSALVVNTYARLSPAFPDDYQIQDLDVTSDGVYLVMVVAQVAMNDILLSDPDYNAIESSNSTLSYWNGADIGTTTVISLPSVNMTAYKTFGQSQYSFGYDVFGAGLFNPSEKVLTLPQMQSPFFNAKSSIGSAVMWAVPEYINDRLFSAIHYFGQLDQEMPSGHYRPALVNVPLLSDSNSLKIPFMLPVSNNIYGASFNGYPKNIFGVGKIYFSAIENSGNSNQYTFYMLHLFTNGLNNAAAGVYETQNQLFSKRQVVKQVRVYLDPITVDQGFQMDIIGIDGSIIYSQIISIAAETITLGETMGQFDPVMAPTASIGIRISNLGSETPNIHKIELDIVPEGK